MRACPSIRQAEMRTDFKHPSKDAIVWFGFGFGFRFAAFCFIAI